MGLRAARSPPRKSAGAARRPSRDGRRDAVRKRSRVPGKKSGLTNSSNLEVKNKIKVRYSRGRQRYNITIRY